MTAEIILTSLLRIQLIGGAAVVLVLLLRRLALRGAEWWLGATVPGYLLYLAGRAWAESARPHPVSPQLQA